MEVIMNKRFKAAYLTVLTVGILVVTPAGLFAASDFMSQPVTCSSNYVFTKVSQLFSWMGKKCDSSKTKVSESISYTKEKYNSVKTKAFESRILVSEYMMALPVIYFVGKSMLAYLPDVITDTFVDRAMLGAIILGSAGRFIPSVMNWYKKDDQDKDDQDGDQGQ